MPSPSTVQPPDSPEARKYNQIRRRVGKGEFLVGLGLLVGLLLTGWTGWLGGLGWHAGGQSYAFALFIYVLILLAISKAVGLALDYYGFRLEHVYQLSNQKLRAWIWDEIKGLLVTAVLGAALGELLYLIICGFPQQWWLG